MGVTQIGREHRQALFDIHAGSVPIKKGGHGKSVPKIMEAWAEAIRGLSQADLAREFDERLAHYPVRERDASVGEEEAGGWGTGIKILPPTDIRLEPLDGGGMKREQTRLDLTW